jgi:nucleoside-diphosphate-sugar epimerase
MGLNLVIGAGWLGLPLAKSLDSSGLETLITNRSSLVNYPAEKALSLDLEHDLEHPQTIQLVNKLSGIQLDCVIGCFPPGFRKKEPSIFIENWEKVVALSHQLQAKKVVMISTSGVYPSVAGVAFEEDVSLDKAADAGLSSHTALALLKAEQVVKESGIPYIIARLSGLVGPQRHPARFLSMMKQVSSVAPANMLHQRDAIAAIRFLVENISNQTVNISTPNTTSKLNFYTRANQQFGESFTMPTVVATPDKQVSSAKLVNMGFHFHFNHVLEFFNDQNL